MIRLSHRALARSALPPTPERIARHVHRRVAVSLTFRRFLSPLDTDPSRRLPRGPAPGCEDPWAAARARRPSPAPCGMRLSPTGVRRPPGLRGTALVLRRRAVRPHGGAPPGPTPHEKAQSTAPTSRRMRFSVTSPLGRRGAQSPRQPAGHYGEWPNWANVLEQPPASLAGGCAGEPQASAWGPASRKSAVWAEGLAESAPRARPGHHQAASCGLRGCRELSITSLAPRPRAPCPASSGRWALTPGSPPSPRPSS